MADDRTIHDHTVNAVDAMWLGMDQPDNLMVIDALVWLKGQPEHERFRELVLERMVHRFPIFQQRPLEGIAGLGRPHWQDALDFDIERHCPCVQLPEPGDDDVVRTYVEEQMRRPLDRGHPLWEIHLLCGYRHPDGTPGSIVLFRYHHALADGAALIQVLISLTDAEPDPPAVEPAGWPVAVTSHQGIGDQLRGAGELVLHTGAQLIHLAENLPRLLSPHGVSLALGLIEQTAKVADKLLLRSDPPSLLHTSIGVEKRAAWSSPRSLDDVRAVGKRHGATINDVMVAALSGALSRWIADQGEQPIDVTTMVPVDLRPPGARLSPYLGNQFALVFLKLPSGSWTPRQRVIETKQRMDVIKHSPESAITFGLTEGIGLIGANVGKPLVDFFADKAVGVTTNVIGPREQRYFGGAEMTGLLGWVPGSGHQALGACIASYDGSVRVGFKVDAAAVGDPQPIVDAFDAEMDALIADGRRLTASVPRKRRKVT
jgi:WS/DGAT/MGAT family acyltransferase